jgi:hypothetical protein
MSIWMEMRGPLWITLCGAVAILLLRRTIILAQRLMRNPSSLYPPGLSNAQEQRLKGLHFIFGVGLAFLSAFLLRVGLSFQALWSGEGRSGPHLMFVLVYALFFVSYLTPDYGRVSQHLKAAPAQSFTTLLIVRAMIMGVLFSGAFVNLADW